MFKTMAFALVTVLFLAISAQAANEQLVQELKHMGQAVDNLSIHISKASSDAEATAIAQAVQQTFAAQLGGNPKPDVVVSAMPAAATC